MSVHKSGTSDLTRAGSDERERASPSESESTADDASERSAVLKFDLVVVSTLTVFYFLSFLDRTNIGNARVAGLQKELHMSDRQYSFALTLTYIPYILVEIPSNLLLKGAGPHVYLPLLVVLWGLAATFQGFVKSYGGLLAARFFLGLFEGGLLPGIILYMSSFYPRRRLQTRLGLLFTATSIAGAFSGLLAAGIVHMDGLGGLHGWSWVFILEGILTVLFGAFSFSVLPRAPQLAPFLTHEEKQAVVRMLARDGTLDEHTERFRFREARKAWTHAPQLWFVCPIIFFNGTTLFGLAFFVPSIVNALGNSPNQSQLLSVPPYVASFVVSMAAAVLCDKYGQRGAGIIVFSLVSIVGYAVFLTSKDSHVRYFSLFLQTIGAYGVPSAASAWNANNISPYYKRATAIGTTLVMSVGGGILSTWIFTDPPGYVRATRIDLAFCAGQIVLAVANIAYLHRQNKLRSQMPPRPVVQGMGDLDQNFVYTL